VLLDGWVADLGLLAALAALVLLPGLMLVRAPWSAVPFLSLAFWMLTWAWTPWLGSRLAFVQASLVFFGLLTALRLPRLQGMWPRAPIVALVGVALGLLGPWFVRGLAPGAGAPFRALTTRLLVWRDGLPLTYEPLLAVHHFGPALRAVDLLAADLALLAGGEPARAAHLAQLAAQGLALLAAFELARRLARPRSARLRAPGVVSGADDAGVGAALTSVAGLGLVTWASLATDSWAGPNAPWNAPVLEGACAAMGLAWLGRGRGRGAALAAGALLAAALVTQPHWLASLGLLAAGLLATRLVWAATALVRQALIVRQAWALAVTLTALLPSLVLRYRASGTGPPGAAWTDELANLALLFGAALLCALLAGPSARLFHRLPARPAWLVWVLLAAVAVSGWGRAWTRAVGWPEPSAAQRREWPKLVRAHDPLTALCIDPHGPGAWLPALAGQAVRPLPVPLRAQRMLAPAARRGACVSPASAFGLSAPAPVPAHRPAFVVVPEI
jgi:hypothetical protein